MCSYKSTIDTDFDISCGVVCVILRLAVSVQHRLVTDGQRDTQPQLIPALASVSRVIKHLPFMTELMKNKKVDAFRYTDG